MSSPISEKTPPPMHSIGLMVSNRRRWTSTGGWSLGQVIGADDLAHATYRPAMDSSGDGNQVGRCWYLSITFDHLLRT